MIICSFKITEAWFYEEEISRKIAKMEKEVKEMESSFKNLEQKVDLIIELLSPNKISRKQKVNVENEKDN